MIMERMSAKGKEMGLLGFEMVKDIFVASEPFSPMNEILTPTFKIRRDMAYRAYRVQIEAMYNFE
jgi:long-chain acyl-CoA synthetase